MMMVKTESEAELVKAAFEKCGKEPVIVKVGADFYVCRSLYEARELMALLQ